jgi:hypothetical protein
MKNYLNYSNYLCFSLLILNATLAGESDNKIKESYCFKDFKINKNPSLERKSFKINKNPSLLGRFERAINEKSKTDEKLFDVFPIKPKIPLYSQFKIKKKNKNVENKKISLNILDPKNIFKLNLSENKNNYSIELNQKKPLNDLNLDNKDSLLGIDFLDDFFSKQNEDNLTFLSLLNE